MLFKISLLNQKVVQMIVCFNANSVVFYLSMYVKYPKKNVHKKDTPNTIVVDNPKQRYVSGTVPVG
jgi:hypothetical protein